MSPGRAEPVGLPFGHGLPGVGVPLQTRCDTLIVGVGVPGPTVGVDVGVIVLVTGGVFVGVAVPTCATTTAVVQGVAVPCWTVVSGMHTRFGSELGPASRGSTWNTRMLVAV